MKKLFVLLVALVPLSASAQTNSGKIIYNHTIQLNIDFGDMEGMEEIKAKMPKEKKFQRELLFNEKATLYQKYTAPADDEVDVRSGETMVKMMTRVPENIVYRDLDNNTSTQQRDFMGKTFLIKDDDGSEKLAWKLTGEQQEIAGYNCVKAELQDTSRKVIAWFTMDIPVSAGPNGFGQLPGMIMKLELEERDMVIEADQVSLEAILADAIVEPSKGKKVTEEEFEEIVEAKMKKPVIVMGSQATLPPVPAEQLKDTLEVKWVKYGVCFPISVLLAFVYRCLVL